MRMRDFRHEGEFLTAGWTLHNGTEVRGRVAEFAGFTLDSDRDAMVSAINNAQELLAAPELLAVVKMAQTEAVTLKARLPEPYASNMARLAEACAAAIARAEGGAK